MSGIESEDMSLKKIKTHLTESDVNIKNYQSIILVFNSSYLVYILNKELI